MNTEKEEINHPDHYNSLSAKCKKCKTRIECKDVIREMICNKANAVKYIWRADHKGSTIKDLRKAIWYLNDEIKRLTEQQDEIKGDGDIRLGVFKNENS